MRLEALSWILLAFAASGAAGQSSAPAASSRNSTAAMPGGAAPGGVGFSIETEMLTYTSLEDDSEVLACETARYLVGGETAAASPNAPCPKGDNTSGVVIVASKSTIFDDFQQWRADMAAMNALQQEAQASCGSGDQAKRPTMGSSVLGLSGLSAAGEAIPILQGVLGVFAKDQSVSPVTGTVQDQALVDEVARQLRALNISVLVPDRYSPFALGRTDDATSSPFLSALTELIKARATCVKAKEAASAQQNKPKEDAPAEQNKPREDAPAQQGKDEIDSIIAGIDQFMAVVTGGTNRPAASPGAAESPSSPESTSHIASVLAADGLARAIGLHDDRKSNSRWQILWLKALESGGSVTKEGNVLRTKVRYSGGAVVTYALFTLDGKLSCSGNVYDYAGSLAAKSFGDELHQKETEAKRQLPVLRGNCSPP